MMKKENNLKRGLNFYYVFKCKWLLGGTDSQGNMKHGKLEAKNRENKPRQGEKGAREEGGGDKTFSLMTRGHWLNSAV